MSFCYDVLLFIILYIVYLCVNDSNEQNKFDQTKITNQILVISILQNLSHKYSNPYSIIKFVAFEPIYYAINMRFCRCIARSNQSNYFSFQKI